MRYSGIFLVLLFSLSACKSKQGLKLQEINLDLEVEYFDRQIGGTEEAGVNEIYYFRPVNPELELQTLKVQGQTLSLSLVNGFYRGTTELRSSDEVGNATWRSVELFGRLKNADSQIHMEIDSVPLREEIYMPVAIPTGN